MKKPIWIQCPQCMGHGEVPLSDGLADVLEIVRKQSGVTAPIIHATCKDAKWVKISAINNRLVTLERHGLIKRERRGKFFAWSVK